jgi:hypothetical protein
MPHISRRKCRAFFLEENAAHSETKMLRDLEENAAHASTHLPLMDHVELKGRHVVLPRQDKKKCFDSLFRIDQLNFKPRLLFHQNFRHTVTKNPIKQKANLLSVYERKKNFTER